MHKQLAPERLKQKREELRFSQRALARAAKVPYSAIINMESGRVKDTKHLVIKAIADVLSEDPSFFYEELAV